MEQCMIAASRRGLYHDRAQRRLESILQNQYPAVRNLCLNERLRTVLVVGAVLTLIGAGGIAYANQPTVRPPVEHKSPQALRKAATPKAGASPSNSGSAHDPCGQISVTVTADTTALDTTENQNTLRRNLVSAVDAANPGHLPELRAVAAQLVRAAASTGAKSSEALGTQLTNALQAACWDLNGETQVNAPSVAKAVSVAARASGLPNPNGNDYTLYLGSVSSLQAQGGFLSSLEASFIARSVLYGQRASRVFSQNGGPLWNGVFELTYSKIAALSSSKSTASSSPASSTSINPFTSASGVLRLNLSVEYLRWFSQSIGFTGGGGFTSRTSSTKGANARLSPRGFFGVEFLANYGPTGNANRTTGRVIVAYAYDKFWTPYDSADTTTPNQPDRIVVDARLDTPGILKSKKVKFSFQVYVDAPMASHGPADVAVSLLVSTDLQSLISGT